MRPGCFAPALILALASQTAAGASPQPVGLGSIADTKTLCAEAAQLFAEGKVDAAFERMAVHWPLPQAEIDAAALTSKSQQDIIRSRFGAAIGVEELRSVEVGASFVGHLFALKYENHAMRFSCRFYKPHDKWLVNSFNWDDEAMVSFGQ